LTFAGLLVQLGMVVCHSDSWASCCYL